MASYVAWSKSSTTVLREGLKGTGGVQIPYFSLGPVLHRSSFQDLFAFGKRDLILEL